MIIEEQITKKTKVLAAEMGGYARRIDLACEIAYHHGGAIGDRRKAWVIDQMVRMLLGDDYEAFVRDATNGGKEDWDVGVMP